MWEWADVEREGDHESGSRGVVGVDGDRAAVSLDDLAGDGQAQPGAPGGALAGVVEAREALGADLIPVATREQDVEHDEVKGAFARQPQPMGAVEGDLDAESLSFQAA